VPKHLPNNDATGAPQNAVRFALEHLTRGEDAPLPIIVAVSGGPDSICLADAMLELAAELRLRPVIAHLNHGLRGDEAAADAKYVRDFAAQRAAPCAIAHADVQARAAERKQSLELAAREARYEFLARVAHEHGAAHIALAHQADDQAETILLRLIRGTGVAGLRGMSAISPHPSDPSLSLVRPLLGLTRAQIEAYCAARELVPRTDSSNASRHHLRNRVRRELLPLLETFNPGIRRVLLHLADGATSDLEIVSQVTQSAYANALAGLISQQEKRAQMAQNARARVEAHFGIHQLGDDLEQAVALAALNCAARRGSVSERETLAAQKSSARFAWLQHTRALARNAPGVGALARLMRHFI
jgi:tRNA(Ile)-lysidine synthetase-like protein